MNININHQFFQTQQPAVLSKKPVLFGKRKRGKPPVNSAALLACLKKGDEKSALKEINKPGFNPNLSFGDGSFPLITALSVKLMKLAQKLILTGADLNKATSIGETPLHSAANNNYPELAALLIEKGADVNTVISSGWTPLGIAVQNNHSELAAWLIEHGADVNKVTSTGWTPLNIAVMNNYPELAALLIEKGTDQNLYDLLKAICWKDYQRSFEKLLTGSRFYNNPQILVDGNSIWYETITSTHGDGVIVNRPDSNRPKREYALDAALKDFFEQLIRQTLTYPDLNMHYDKLHDLYTQAGKDFPDESTFNTLPGVLQSLE